jgi:GT2 family glycosyltransferase
MFLMRDRDILNASGILHHYLYFGYCEGYRQPDRWGADREIAVASGACLMIKARVLDSLGYLFNKDFFMYHEDTDLCIRARLAGYRVMLSANAVVWHDYKFGSGKMKFFHMEKNRLFLMLQNYQCLTLVLLVPAILFTEAQVLLHSLMSGWLGYKLKSYLWLLSNMGEILKKRRMVQKNRKVSDLQIMGQYVTDISFEALDNLGLKYITNPALRAYFRLVKGLLRIFGGRDACRIGGANAG